MRDTILDILSDLVEDVDFDTCDTLIDDGLLSSLDIIQLIGALNDEFDISIPATEIIPDNFNSVDAMVAMVERLADE
ncbi:MAG: phosphopantetheine-binding protein [Clostridiales bacterium]|nr:phosphopantetheine-binding protein [Clostridiales bacterium]MDD7174953.1 phosphopantetheine-binding protein [Clostridiales bacterium]MDY5513791.1 phosphopantetheine-binding protein [Candidatus Ventricola sp.]